MGISQNENGGNITLHRYIQKYLKPYDKFNIHNSVDHINRHVFDNRDDNLRWASQSDQNYNRSSFSNKKEPCDELKGFGINFLPRYIRYEKGAERFVIDKHPVLFLNETNEENEENKKPISNGTRSGCMFKRYYDVIKKAAKLDEKIQEHYPNFTQFHKIQKEQHEILKAVAKYHNTNYCKVEVTDCWKHECDWKDNINELVTRQKQLQIDLFNFLEDCLNKSDKEMLNDKILSFKKLQKESYYIVIPKKESEADDHDKPIIVEEVEYGFDFGFHLKELDKIKEEHNIDVKTKQDIKDENDIPKLPLHCYFSPAKEGRGCCFKIDIKHPKYKKATRKQSSSTPCLTIKEKYEEFMTMVHALENDLPMPIGSSVKKERKEKHSEDFKEVVMKDIDSGMIKDEVCTKHGISEAMFYRWKKGKEPVVEKKTTVDHAPDLKENILHEVIVNKMKMSEASKQYGVSATTIQTWRNTKERQDGIAIEKITRVKISDEIKKQALEDMQNGMTQAEVARKYDIKESSVGNWKTYKKPKASQDTIDKVLEDIKNGMTKTDASKKYDIPQRTIFTWQKKHKQLTFL
jgi:transposase-like protein